MRNVDHGYKNNNPRRLVEVLDLLLDLLVDLLVLVKEALVAVDVTGLEVGQHQTQGSYGLALFFVRAHAACGFVACVIT